MIFERITMISFTIKYNNRGDIKKMGLDVYLYKKNDLKNWEKWDRLENAMNDFTEKRWEKKKDGRKYEELSNEETDLIHNLNKETRKRWGLDDWGEAPKKEEQIEIPSKINPNHLFKIGYFRSSYNDGGINSILRNTIEKDLYYVFPEGNDDYYIFPDWEETRERAVKLHDLFKKYLDDFGFVSCFHIDVQDDTGINSEKRAIKKYLDALKIVIETIDHVLAQPDKEKYYLHWSS